jgi:hypothetical protein
MILYKHTEKAQLAGEVVVCKLLQSKRIVFCEIERKSHGFFCCALGTVPSFRAGTTCTQNYILPILLAVLENICGLLDVSSF